MTRQRAAGFTLVEVLVAILIFAIMSAVAYRALTLLLDGRERLDRDVQKWREVALLFARMKQDFSIVAPRPALDAAGMPSPPFLAGSGSAREYDAPLVFSRAGDAGRERAPAAPQRMGYRLSGHTVELVVWPALDQGPRPVTATAPLLEGVAELRFRYLHPGGAWQESWPPPQGTPAPPGRSADMPAAVQVSLRLQSGETFVRLFALPALGNAR